MHYRNGQEAHVGDVIEFVDYQGLRNLGVLMSISPGSNTCNGSAARFVTGGQTPHGFVLIQRQHDSQTVTLGKCDLVRRFSEPTDLPRQ